MLPESGADAGGAVGGIVVDFRLLRRMAIPMVTHHQPASVTTGDIKKIKPNTRLTHRLQPSLT